ncbi:sugar transferase [Histidinibacterium aquaticum]|uniref:Sugar transferase n=1 Tax=Histidinibacterium aquaticum TaxID=2613962 RepID=A0A5J5GE76_9RHOB|nr:sugar transferase [Histidinibacterium aquaticum]KAA9006092.1 sugar transferase [Histidinibacterium aquaticum]
MKLEPFAHGLATPVHAAHRPNAYRLGGKRLLDLSLCLAALMVLAPVMALIWAALKRGGGPALFRQRRVGAGGRVFDCLKFRSMVPDAEAALCVLRDQDPAIDREWRLNQKLLNDPRITPLGNLLRRTSLDELPQLWNVLRGEMSLVGPRPFTVEQTELYRQAGGAAYFLMRPGLSGEWQVSGRGRTSFADRVGYDDLYWQRLSLAHDLRLLAATLPAVLRAKGQ